MDTTLYERLLNAAFRFVSFRPRSEKEIHDFLVQKLYKWKIAGNQSVTKAMERLREYGYVDDMKFAEWWVTQRSTFRPKGSRAVRLELAQKGISKDVIDTALLAKETGSEAVSELDDARKAISKKIILWGKLPVIEQKKKVYSFLAQRGFTSLTIQKIIDEKIEKSYNTLT